MKAINSNSKKNFKIALLRDKIDAIDNQIVSLLDERFKIALEIAKEKKNNNIEVVDQFRESEIISKLKNIKKNYISDNATEKIYREILDNSVNEMKKQKNF